MQAVLKRNLAKLTFNRFYVILNTMYSHAIIMSCILLRCKCPFGPFAFNSSELIKESGLTGH